MYLLPILLRCLLAVFGIDLPADPWRIACQIAPPLNEPSRPGLPLPERVSAEGLKVAGNSPAPR